MPLPTSGIITLQDIQAEFGGPTSPSALQNYYRGGAYVPDTTANAGVPTSGLIGVQDFYGADSTSTVVDLTNLDSGISAFGFTTSGTSFTVTAGVRFLSDGQAQKRDSTSPFSFVDLLDAWGRPLATGIGSDYTVRLTVNSGSGPTAGPAVDTDHALSSTRTWDQSVTGENATRTGNWTITIKEGGTTVATSTFTAEASVSTI